MVGALSAAALAVGRRAWQAGQDIETAVTVAGYSAALARGVYEYFSQHATPELEAAVSQSQGLEAMAPQVKRQRRQTIPVAKPVKKYVKRCMDRIIEKKYVDGTVTFTNAPVAGTVNANYLCGITLGTSDTSRTGNTIRVKRITIKGQFNNSGISNYWDNRMIAFWDRQPNGAAPTNSTVISQASVHGPYAHDYVVGWGGSRFEIVSDKRTCANAQLATTGTVVKYEMKWKGNKVVRFSGNAGTVADMVTNNFCLMMQGDAVCDFVGYMTIEYEDA